MNRSTWKGHERAVARFLGTVRAPLSGGGSRHTRSDTLHPSLFVEVKSGKGTPRRVPAIEQLFGITEERAAREGKRAVLVFHETGRSAPVDEWPAYVRLKDGELAGNVVRVTLGQVRALPVARVPGRSQGGFCVSHSRDFTERERRLEMGVP